jgi:predicted GNAT superfamily acetyltransferase
VTILIHLVDSLEAVEHFRVLEHLIWGEPLVATIPTHVIVTAIHNGGGLLAAYAEDGPSETGGMIGLTYWWPGLAVPTTTPDAQVKKASPAPRPDALHNARPDARVDARVGDAPLVGAQPSPTLASAPAPLRLKMCSHMAGVLPAWQGTGLGLRLKLAQRAAILDQGMTDWVTWTYDPLLRTNAAFNLHRLGAICNTYHVNLYGELPDELNAGIPSDRCQVDWWLASVRVNECSQAGPVGATRRAQLPLPADTQVLSGTWNSWGGLTPPSSLPLLDGAPLALPVPDDIYAIRAVDNDLGSAWRLWMRTALQAAFAGGYLLVDCVRHADGQWRYLLTAP